MKHNGDTGSRKLIDYLVPDPDWGAMQGFLATTYELNPDFLEMDFLPSVFNLGAWDNRSWTSRIALEKRLSALDAAVILTEARRYRGRPRSLRLEVLPAVSPRGSALHAKVTLLHFDRAIRLIVGSANLTDQGYRRNREVVCVLTASKEFNRDAPLIAQGLRGMVDALAPWLNVDARRQIEHALEKVESWADGVVDRDTAFVWSSGTRILWRAFISRWPTDELINSISIISPFWSEDCTHTVATLLGKLQKSGCLSAGAELRLLTDAFRAADGSFMPILPQRYSAQDWGALGVRATVQAVDPTILPEEVGGIEGYSGTRDLHAKLILMEGTRNALAYLGSANFTAHGWGFLDSQTAPNHEAGLILRRSRQSVAISNMHPDLVGDPILLSSENAQALCPPEYGLGDDPWPEFIRQVLLMPADENENELQLLIEVSPGSAPPVWSAELPGKDGMPREVLIRTESTQDTSKISFLLRLLPPTLTRLLTEQEILIFWSECQRGRAIPVNVESSAQVLLPISPNSQGIGESELLSYYQGRISWEELFPDPDIPVGQELNPQVPPGPSAGVDKSRIQSYQIREFVEALAGLRQDLHAATESESAMRLALLGPVSPFALAKNVFEAANSGHRTPVAAAFQLVEILACLKSARSFTLSEKLSNQWEEQVENATKKINHLLEQLLLSQGDALTSSRAFTRYRKSILEGGSSF